jgi:hypothetical protein
MRGQNVDTGYPNLLAPLDLGAELDAKRAIDQGARTAASL